MNIEYENLLKSIKSKSAILGVVGLGYVGLPLVVEMVNEGFHVIGIDVDPVKMDKLAVGQSYISDISSEKLTEVVHTGRFTATMDHSCLYEVDVIIICVPTPLKYNQESDDSFVVTVIENIKQYMKKGILITLESTTYPGTTESLIQRELESLGYVVGEDFFLCFSPDRLDPSNPQYNLVNTPKVIGGTTDHCLSLGMALYTQFVHTMVPVTSPKVAEMSKLLENTFRSINIAFINEMAMMCDRLGVDVWEVIDAANTKPFGFMPFYPGPGTGGHCVPMDPMYLSWKTTGFRFYSQFIELAQSTNDNMPYYVVNKTAQILNEYVKSIKTSNILLLGMTYKPDISDLRESSGLEVYELFRDSGAYVEYYDPHADSFRDKRGSTVNSVPYDVEKFKQYDCIVLITSHTQFNYEELSELGVPILDTRNAFVNYPKPNIYKIGHSVLPSVAVHNEAAIV